MTEDVVGAVARGIYSEVLKCPGPEKVFFDALPAEARAFLRGQARSGLEKLRQNVTDRMVAAASELGCDDPETVFVTMLDTVLAQEMN